MSMIVRIFKNIINKITGSFKVMYANGIKDIIDNKRILKGVIDTIIICVYAWFVIYLGHTFVVNLISIGVLMTVINRILEGGDDVILIDISKPFLTIGLFSLVSVLYSFVRESSIVMSILIIPVMTNQIIIKYQLYMDELSGKECVC